MKHKLNFTSGCILEQIYPNVKEPVVNTVHHQAIKDIGNDLEILATCMEDGIVEAISYKKSALGKVMGVQWHPEFSLALNDQVLNPENLFNHFLDHIKNC
jgi:putative glutamine amidotransferase